jgi:hypothetical protein
MRIGLLWIIVAHRYGETNPGEERTMRLIVYYVAIMLLLNVSTVFIGFVVENLFGSIVSLVVFLSLYFVSLWAAWVISVWLTKPKAVDVAVPLAVVAKA